MKFNPIFLILFLSACGSKDRLEPRRQALAAIASSSGQSTIVSLSSPLEEGSTGSCDRLNELVNEARAQEIPKFSYLGNVFKREGFWVGNLEIKNSPFTQFILGEKFQAGNEEEFYQKAKKEYEEGRIGGMNWFFVKMMRNFGLLGLVQFSTINEKILEKFPGVFGLMGPLDDSIFFQLADRAAKINKLPPKQVEKILSSQISLFPADGSWTSFAHETKLNLGAAFRGLQTGKYNEERLCSHVLLHHYFAQLLRIKGHQSPPILRPVGRGRPSRVEPLSASQPEFRRTDVLGAFYDLRLESNIILANEAISSYDPSILRMGIVHKVPDGRTTNKRGSLSDSLGLMEALAYGFEASSPASPFAERDGYVFGDIFAENSEALLPAEVHSLSLGLLVMHFKNLAFLHIKKLDKDGKLVTENALPAGILLGNGEWNGSITQVKLSDVVRLARVVSYLDLALSRFLDRPSADWQSLNPIYTKNTIASIFGKALFTEDELQSILTPIQRNSILRDNLKALKFPLALLLSKLGTGASGCSKEVSWNVESGQVDSLGNCSREELEELEKVFTILSRDNQSPILQQKAKMLRAALENNP